MVTLSLARPPGITSTFSRKDRCSSDEHVRARACPLPAERVPRMMAGLSRWPRAHRPRHSFRYWNQPGDTSNPPRTVDDPLSAVRRQILSPARAAQHARRSNCRRKVRLHVFYATGPSSEDLFRQWCLILGLTLRILRTNGRHGKEDARDGVGFASRASKHRDRIEITQENIQELLARSCSM
jgi:hypothetical protein